MKESCIVSMTSDQDLNDRMSRAPLLALRLVTLMMMVALLTIHVRSLRVFRWELSVSGGLLITYCITSLGLALCAGAQKCGGKVFQAYICAVGAALMAINGAVIWQRWRQAGELTRVVAEMLMALGVPLKRQIMTKVILSASAALAMLLDLLLTQILAQT